MIRDLSGLKNSSTAERARVSNVRQNKSVMCRQFLMCGTCRGINKQTIWPYYSLICTEYNASGFCHNHMKYEFGLHVLVKVRVVCPFKCDF